MAIVKYLPCEMNPSQQNVRKEDQRKKEVQKPAQRKSPENNMSEIDEHILKRYVYAQLEL